MTPAEKILPAGITPAVALEKPRSDAQALNGIAQQTALVPDPALAIGGAGAGSVVAGDSPTSPSFVPGCVTPPAGLTAWWTADGHPFDIAGGYNGYRAASFAPGKVGQAFNFDTHSWVEAPNSDAWHFGSGDFTVDLWAYFRSAGVGDNANILIGNDEGPFFTNKWFFAAGGGVLSFHVNGPGAGTGGFGRYIVHVPWAQQLNRWYHLAVTRAGATWTIYVDGVAVGSETNTLNVPSPNAPLTIGQAENSGFVDGKVDEVEIFKGRALSSAEIQSIVNAGTAGKCKPTRALSFASRVVSPSGNAPNAVATGDFNGDGLLDAAVANAGNNGSIANTLTILQGDGAGHFTVRQTIPVGSPNGIAVGDFDGDGRLDVAATDGNYISVFRGVGDGTFTRLSSQFVGGGCMSSLAAADFDGDGRLDLAVPLCVNHVAVLLGNGDGSFGPDRRYPVGSDPRSIAVGDFNGDGRPDLAVANYGSHDVTVLLNSGGGGFGLGATFPVDGDSTYVVAGDFDGDGRLDLGVANPGAFVRPGSVNILRGNGSGGFSAPIRVSGVSSTSLAAADLNGDGTLDLAVATSSTLLYVLVGNGDGTFAAPTQYTVGDDAVAVAVGDVNGDWHPDLITVDLVPSTVSVLLNTLSAPTPTATLTVNLQGSGSGYVTSSPAGITCPPTCSADFAQGTYVTLVERANATSTFFGWTGAQCFALTCVVPLDAPRSVSAIFNTAPLGTAPTMTCGALNATMISCGFSSSMSTDGTGDVNDPGHFALSGGLTIGGSYPTSTDARTITLGLTCATPSLAGCGGANRMVQGVSYTVTATNLQTASGTLVRTPLAATFTFTDATGPTASVRQTGAGTLRLQFSEPVDSSTLTAANIRWDGAPFPGHISVLGLAGCEFNDPPCNALVRLDFIAGALPTAGSHTLDLGGITDWGGNALTGVSSFPVTISADTTAPTAFLARPPDLGLVSGKRVSLARLQFSEAMALSANGFGAAQSADVAGNYTLRNPDGSPATTGGAIGLGTPIAVNQVSYGNASVTSRFDLVIARLRFSALFRPNVPYTLNVSGLTDEAGNPLSTTSFTLRWPGDTTPPAVRRVNATPTSLFVDFTDEMAATVDGDGSFNTHACDITRYAAAPGSSGEAALNAWLATLGSGTSPAFTPGRGSIDSGAFQDGCTFVQGTTSGPDPTPFAPGTYTLAVGAGTAPTITDSFGNALQPAPTLVTFTVPSSAGTATLTVNLQGSGSGYVTSSPAGITCPATCAADFPQGSAVILTQRGANAESSFFGFGGTAGCFTSCVVSMDGPRSITATYNTAPLGVPPALESCTALNATMISCTFNESMSTDGSADISDFSHYALSGGLTIGGAFTSSTDGRMVTLQLTCVPIGGNFTMTGCGNTNRMTQGGSYVVTVTGVRSASGKYPGGPLTKNTTLNDTIAPAATVTQIGAGTLRLQFSKPVDATTLTGANIHWDGASFPGKIVILSRGPNNCEFGDPPCNALVRLDFQAGALPPAGSHTLELVGVSDGVGNALAAPTSFPFTINADTTPPTAAFLRAADGLFQGRRVSQMQLNFSEAMAYSQNGYNSAQAADVASNYTLFNPDGTFATTGGAGGIGNPITIVQVAFGNNNLSQPRFELRRARLRFSTLLKPGVAYSLNVSNITDQAGNPLGPSAFTIVWPGDTTPLALRFFRATPTGMYVDFSDDVLATADGDGSYNTHACLISSYHGSPEGSASATRLNQWLATLGNNSGGFTGPSTGAFTAGVGAIDSGLFADSCTFSQDPGASTLPLTPGTYTMTIGGGTPNVTDDYGNAISPSPTSVTFTILAHIKGTVYGPTGTPLAGILVRAENAAGGAIEAEGMTDGGGQYDLEVSDGKSYDVSFIPPKGSGLAVQVFNGQRSGATATAISISAPSPTWSLTGSMATPRYFYDASLLPSGKVLVAGGYNTGSLASAEVYDPVAGTWSATGSMANARNSFTLTLLASGKVLAAGGCNSGDCPTVAELYDPVAGTWSATGSLITGRNGHTATLLSSGKVLVTGGANTTGYLPSAEVYDPLAGTWSATGTMTAARQAHTATLLPSGNVLVAGGANSGGDLASAELYDPIAGTWSPTGSMATARRIHTATLVSPGKVLAVGGAHAPNSVLASAELYDPISGTWSTTGSLITGRASHTATLLPSGTVLVAGGNTTTIYLASAELYDPIAGTWSATGSLTTGRTDHTATLLSSGRVLAAGGVNDSGVASAELYSSGGSSGASGIDGHLVAGYPVTGTVTDSGGNPLANVSVQAYLGSACCYLIRSDLTDAAGHYLLELAGASPADTYRIRFAGGTPNEQWANGHNNPGNNVLTGWTAADPISVVNPFNVCDYGTSFTTLLDSSNFGGVSNGGAPTPFSVTSNYCAQQLITYHWNNGNGSPSLGTIGIQGPGCIGACLGSWQAADGVRTDGRHNVDWIANVTPGIQVVLRPGNTYYCFDSDSATWSMNAESLFFGFCRVYGVAYHEGTNYGRSGVDAHLNVAPAGSLTVHVRNSGLTALSGIEVDAQDISTSEFLSATTNAQGDAVLAGQNGHSYKVQARPAPSLGYVQQWYQGKMTFDTADAVAVSGPTAITMTLDIGVAVQGQVLDSVGHAPIANARVFVGRADPGDPCCLFESDGPTNSDGFFTVLVHPGHSYKFQGYTRGTPVYVTSWFGGTQFETATVFYVSEAVTLPGAINLDSGVLLSGTVVDATTGLGIAGMQANASVAGPSGIFENGGRTDSTGAYSFAVHPNRDYKLRIKAARTGPSYVYVWYPNAQSFEGGTTISVGTVDKVVDPARLVAGTRITGNVVGPDRVGLSVGGVNAQDPPSNTLVAQDGIDPGGFINLVVPSGRSYKFAFHPDASTNLIQGWYNAKRFFDTADIVTVGTSPVDLGTNVLDTGVLVSGLVTDDRGVPIENAHVNAQLPGSGSGENGANTAANGIFSFAVHANTSYVFRVDGPFGTTYVPQYYDNQPTFGQATQLLVGTTAATLNTVRLVPGVAVTGTVTGSGPQANVFVAAFDGLASTPVRLAPGVLTQADGSFRLLVPKDRQIKIQFGPPATDTHLPTWAGGVAAFEDAAIISIGTTDPTPITIDLPTGVALTGFVSDSATGASIAGAFVNANAPTGVCCKFLYGTQTNSDGYFTLLVAPNASYKINTNVAATAPVPYLAQFYDNKGGDFDAATAVAVGPTGSALNAIKLVQGVRVSGTVNNALGAPLTGIRVQMFATGGCCSSLAQKTTSSGAYAAIVPAGTDFKVSFTSTGSLIYAAQWNGGAPDYTTAAAVPGVGGTSVVVNATMSNGFIVSGTVTDRASHQPVVGGPIRISSAGTGGSQDAVVQRTSADANGQYRLVVAGGVPYKLWFRSPQTPQYAPQHWDNKPTWALADAFTVPGDSNVYDAQLDAVEAAATASCTLPLVSPNPIVLPGAAVDVFSGTTLAKSFVADGAASFQLFGLTPSSTYVLRYRGTVNAKVVECYAPATTAANGTATVGPSAPNYQNHLWGTAMRLTSGQVIQGRVVRPFGAVWYKLAIAPQQHVRIDLTGLTADYTLAVYRDLVQVTKALKSHAQQNTLAGVSAGSQGATAADNVDSDNVDSDNVDSDNVDSDNVDSDNVDSDNVDSDNVDSDNVDSDNVDSDNVDSGNVHFDNVDSDNVDSAGHLGRLDVPLPIYNNVQRRGIRAYSAHKAFAPESITLNTRGLTGDLYIRVRGSHGAFDAANDFTLVAQRTVDASCVGATFTPHGPTTLGASLATGKKSLILTNTAALGLGDTPVLDPTTLTLAAPVLASSTTLAVNETVPAWSQTGWLAIDGEIVHYTGHDALTKTFVLDARGDLGTQPATHLLAASVAKRSLSRAEFLGTLQAIALRDDVQGYVFDVATDSGIQAAFADLSHTTQCVGQQNLVTESIRKLVTSFRTTNAIEYLVMVGGDRAIPFRRIPDRAEIARESRYNPPVDGASISESTLVGDWFLTDDYYATANPIVRFDHELYVPDIASGRLVESAEDIVAYLRAFTQVGGSAHPTNALTSGYDFNADLAQFISGQFSTKNGMNVDSVISVPASPPGTPAAIAKAVADPLWTAADLRSKLFGPTHYGVYSLMGHFQANRLVPADNGTGISSLEVARAADGRFIGALVQSIGCHSGYNIVDADAVQGLTQPVAFPEAFVSRGATLVGGTGYQYGETELLKNTELLLAKLTQELGYNEDTSLVAVGPNGMPIGKALRAAKTSYISELASYRGLDEKIVGISTLYGLPQMRFALPNTVARPRPADVVPTATSVSGLSIALATQTYVLNGTPSGGGLAQTFRLNTHGGYYDAGSSADTSAEPYRPIRPRSLTSIRADGALARGAVFLGGTYTDLPGFTPTLSVPTTESAGGAPTYLTPVFLPVRPFKLNDTGAETLVVTPFQYRAPTAGDRTGRLFGSVQEKLYYSSRTGTAALAGPPDIRSVVLTQNDAGMIVVTVTLVTGNDPGIARLDAARPEREVYVTYTADTGAYYGSWASVQMIEAASSPLTPTSSLNTYTATVDPQGNAAALRVMIQAVSGVGDVAVASDNGNLFRFVAPPAAPPPPPPGSPPPPPPVDTRPNTTLTLSAPSQATYGTSFGVTATLRTTATPPAPLGGQSVLLSFGGTTVTVGTGADGVANATFKVGVTPRPSPTYPITAAFAENATAHGSSASGEVQVGQGSSLLVGQTPPSGLTYGDSAAVATLQATGATQQTLLGEQPVTIAIATASRRTSAITDARGVVRFDTGDFAGLAPGTYQVNVRFAGNAFYVGSDINFPLTVIDLSPPTVTTSATSGGQPYPAGIWTTQAVTVHFTCLSPTAVASCPADVTLSGDGDSQWVTGVATDTHGNATPGSFGPIRIDRTAPTISAAASPAPNGNGWNNSPVTVTFTCADATSGVASCTAPATLATDGASQTASGTATDNVGNSSGASATVKIDRTPPTITAGASTPSGAYISGTWTKETVTVTFTCSDATSGPLSCPPLAVLESDGDHQSANGTATDLAGNTASAGVSEIRIDKTPPSIMPTVTTADGKPYTTGTWTNQTVTVHFTCTDTLSLISATTGCPADVVRSTDLDNQSATGTTTDNAGNSATATVNNIKIDKSAPTITAAATTSDGKNYVAGSWTNKVVTVHFTCNDSLSGIAASGCPGDVVLDKQGDNQSASGTARDQAGNTASATFSPVRIDLTPPAITTKVTTADGKTYTTGTWTNQTVTVTFTCANALAATTCPDPVVLAGDGENQSAIRTATDQAGNTSTAAVSNINIDKTAPIISAAAKTADGVAYAPNTWTNQKVTVQFDCADALSKIATCPGDVTFGQGDNQVATGTATDRAGNSASAAFTGIRVDLAAPTISASVKKLSGAPYLTGTWSNEKVVVHFTCADDLSGVASCQTDITLGDGDHQSASGTVADNAGNRASATVTEIRVDTTPPAVTYTGNASPYAADQTVAITCAASDPLSGVASTTCASITGAAYTFTSGSTTYSATATDNAGNVGTGTTTVVVIATYDSLCTLTTRFSNNAGVAQSLCAKLAAAKDATARGNHSAASNSIGAYQNEVSAQSGKAFTADQAATLLRLARALVP